MQSIPASGYTVKASEFTKHIPESQRERFTKALEEKDVLAVDEILWEHLSTDFPPFESSFVLGPDDDASNLERGVVYICFQEDDLYVKEPKRQTELMRHHGISPEFNRWTTWG